MKCKELFLLGILCCIFFINFISADTNAGSMIVRADVQAETISIDVNSSVDFGEVAKGYKSDDLKIEIINKGNTKIRVTPRLDDSYAEGIFNYIYFHRILNDPQMQIGNYSIEIDQPSTFGGIEKETIYILLDLRAYSGVINSRIDDHTTNVIFWATKV